MRRSRWSAVLLARRRHLGLPVLAARRPPVLCEWLTPLSTVCWRAEERPMQAQSWQFEGACARIYIAFFETFPNNELRDLVS